jgi:hypothetical protein
MLNVEYPFSVSFGLRVKGCSEQAWWLNFCRVLSVERMPGEIVFIALAIGYHFGWRNDNEIGRNKVIACREG